MNGTRDFVVDGLGNMAETMLLNRGKPAPRDRRYITKEQYVDREAKKLREAEANNDVETVIDKATQQPQEELNSISTKPEYGSVLDKALGVAKSNYYCTCKDCT